MPLQSFRPLLLSDYVVKRSVIIFILQRLALSKGKMTFVFLESIIHIVYRDKVVWLLKIIKLIRTESIPQFQKFFQVLGLKQRQLSLETYLMLILQVQYAEFFEIDLFLGSKLLF